MPWLALPYSERTLQGDSWSKFPMNGVPSVFVVGPDGEVLSADGRDMVKNDPEAKAFPFEKESSAIPYSFPGNIRFSFIFGSVLQSGKSTVNTDAALTGKVVMIYFSGKWCSPCRSFTPKLIEYYEKMVKVNSNFSIVVVSHDKTEKAFDDYYGSMPSSWLALPYFSWSAIGAGVGKTFGLVGIPTLIVLGPNKW